MQCLLNLAGDLLQVSTRPYRLIVRLQQKEGPGLGDEDRRGRWQTGPYLDSRMELLQTMESDKNGGTTWVWDGGEKTLKISIWGGFWGCENTK